LPFATDAAELESPSFAEFLGLLAAPQLLVWELFLFWKPAEGQVDQPVDLTGLREQLAVRRSPKARHNRSIEEWPLTIGQPARLEKDETPDACKAASRLAALHFGKRAISDLIGPESSNR
jgi:hypothetical protein